MTASETPGAEGPGAEEAGAEGLGAGTAGTGTPGTGAPEAEAVGAGTPGAAVPGAGAPRREEATDADRAVVAAQLGRSPRGTRAVAHRCPCGLPDVVETTPRLADGTPFPTLFYLTCPKATAACSRLESAGVMKEMMARLQTDRELAAAYLAAHEDYLARRTAIADVPEIDGTSAGGMPGRVKCLHVLLGHALGAGPGVNPLGDEVLAMVGEWWSGGPCVDVSAG